MGTLQPADTSTIVNEFIPYSGELIKLPSRMYQTTLKSTDL